jgi:hypothetical protein
MLRYVCLMIMLALSVQSFAAEKSEKKTPNLKEKVLYVNKPHYDKMLEKKYKKNSKKNEPMKIYRRKDGSIDTFKTINEAKR